MLLSCQITPTVIPAPDSNRPKYLNEDTSFVYCNSLKWKEKLSENDKRIILELVDSSYNIVRRSLVPDVLIPSLIHRFDLSKERENLFFWEEDRSLFEQTADKEEKEFDEYLLSLIEPECLAKNLKNPITHYHCKGDDYLNVLLVRQSRRMKKGLDVHLEIPDSFLTGWQKDLLKNSKLK